LKIGIIGDMEEDKNILGNLLNIPNLLLKVIKLMKAKCSEF
jgi:hypothetical protein